MDGYNPTRRADDPIVVTTKDIYALALETKSTVDSILVLQTQSTATAADHEARIRGLEKWRYALPTSLVLAVFANVAAFASVWLERSQLS